MMTFLRIISKLPQSLSSHTYNAFLNFPFLMAYFLKTAHLLKSYPLTKTEIKQTHVAIDLFRY